MKKKYINYIIIKLILYINLFDYIINQGNEKYLNTTGKIFEEKIQKDRKKSLFMLFIKITGSFVGIILLYVIIKSIIKKIKLKKDIYKYLNSVLIKKGCLDEESIAYASFYSSIKYFFDFIMNELMNSCKYKDKGKYTKFESGCSICLREFKPETKVIITSCEHIFHYTCMNKYLHLIENDFLIKRKENNFSNAIKYFNCPNCKFNMLQKKKLENNKKENYDEKIIKVEINNNQNSNNLNSDNHMNITNSIKRNDIKYLSDISLSSSTIRLDTKISKIPSKKSIFLKKIRDKRFEKSFKNKNKNKKDDNNKNFIINNSTKETSKIIVEKNKSES